VSNQASPYPSKFSAGRLVLASVSPRRLDLLAQIGIKPDDVIPADIDESPLKKELPADYARRMACEKANHVRAVMGPPEAFGGFVLAGDTVVALGRRILPKTKTESDARRCLAALSGRRHRVYGGIALSLADGSMRVRVVQSHVSFRRLTARDIDFYISSGEWHGKAGGYAVQGLAARYIRYIAGSYSNIVGLSLFDVAAMLDAASWPPETKE
jgi:septum formation protein